jgi:hypothetical protein
MNREQLQIANSWVEARNNEMEKKVIDSYIENNYSDDDEVIDQSMIDILRRWPSEFNYDDYWNSISRRLKNFADHIHDLWYN